MKIHYNQLITFTKKNLRKAGLDQFSTNAVSSGLCEASFRGTDSHGIRLLPHYINSALKGRKNPKPKFIIKKKYSSLISLDADHAFGHAAGFKAMNVGSKIAKKNGIAAVSVINSSHPGAMATIVQQGVKENLLVFGFTNANSLILNHNGKDAFFGTNPICFGAPRGKNDYYCLDMATSKVSFNKVLSHREKNKKMNKNEVADINGKDTVDPFKAAYVYPTGEYKGYGLASMIEVLCGVYSGMNFGKEIPSMYEDDLSKKRKISQFYILIKTDGSINHNYFIKRMNNFSTQVRSSKAQKNKKVLLPNDPEIQRYKMNKKNGINIDKKMLKSLNNISLKLGLKNNKLF